MQPPTPDAASTPLASTTASTTSTPASTSRTPPTPPPAASKDPKRAASGRPSRADRIEAVRARKRVKAEAAAAVVLDEIRRDYVDYRGLKVKLFFLGKHTGNPGHNLTIVYARGGGQPRGDQEDGEIRMVLEAVHQLATLVRHLPRFLLRTRLLGSPRLARLVSGLLPKKLRGAVRYLQDLPSEAISFLRSTRSITGGKVLFSGTWLSWRDDIPEGSTPYLSESTADMAALLELLASRDHEAVGVASKWDYSGKPVVFGNCWPGGNVATCLPPLVPGIDRIITIGSPFYTPEMKRQVDDRTFAGRHPYDQLEYILWGGYGHPYAVDRETWTDWVEGRLLNPLLPEFAEPLSRVPTLLLHSEADAIISCRNSEDFHREFTEAYPDAPVTYVPLRAGSGHRDIFENPDFLKPILSFLGGIMPTAAPVSDPDPPDSHDADDAKAD